MKQRTLASSFVLSGIGTHSGEPSTVTVYPASESTGLIFKKGNAVIPALWDKVHGTMMSTQISNDEGDTIATVEHILAALASNGITNAMIELEGHEIPIMDGSSLPFTKEILRVGTIEQSAFSPAIEILKPIEIRTHYGFARFEPNDEFFISMVFTFGNRWPNHSYSLDFHPSSQDFNTEIAPARTFGFYEDAEALWAKGLAKGSSLANVVVIKDGRVINEEGLRFKDEFIRHKILDAIGDFSLAGSRIIGKFRGANSGHGMNNQLLRALLEDQSSFKRVSI